MNDVINFYGGQWTSQIIFPHLRALFSTCVACAKMKVHGLLNVQPSLTTLTKALFSLEKKKIKQRRGYTRSYGLFRFFNWMFNLQATTLTKILFSLEKKREDTLDFMDFLDFLLHAQPCITTLSKILFFLEKKGYTQKKKKGKKHINVWC